MKEKRSMEWHIISIFHPQKNGKLAKTICGEQRNSNATF